MALFIAGLVIFLGVHSVRIVAEPWRQRQRARLGAGTWKALYALASLGGFALMLWGYGQARQEPLLLWSPPHGLRHPAALLTLVAFALLAAAYVPGTRIKAAVGHPMLAGVFLWALAHLLVKGTFPDALLFGGFLLWAAFAFASSRRRDRLAGTRYAVQGVGRDVAAVLVGLGAWAAFALLAHRFLIGVQPFAAG